MDNGRICECTFWIKIYFKCTQMMVIVNNLILTFQKHRYLLFVIGKKNSYNISFTLIMLIYIWNESTYYDRLIFQITIAIKFPNPLSLFIYYHHLLVIILSRYSWLNNSKLIIWILILMRQHFPKNYPVNNLQWKRAVVV